MNLDVPETSFDYSYQVNVFDLCKCDLTWNDYIQVEFHDFACLMDDLCIRWFHLTYKRATKLIYYVKVSFTGTKTCGLCHILRMKILERKKPICHFVGNLFFCLNCGYATFFLSFQFIELSLSAAIRLTG